MQYDVIVIGSGPGGYVAAIRAAQLKLKTAIIEKSETLGGTCLNIGCIPSKALLESADLYHKVNKQAKRHGIICGDVELDVAKLIKRKDDVVRVSSKGVSLLMEKNGITVYQGVGELTTATSVKITNGEDTQEITGKNIVLATGSKSASLPGIEITGKRVISSTEALNLTAVPKHLIVIGAGAIGLELGSVWKRLGADVTVIEYMDRIVPMMDGAISEELEKALKKERIRFKLNTAVTDVKETADGVELTIKNGDKTESITGDYCLISVGRAPMTDGLGLATIGITLDKKGRIPVNERLETIIAGIYAIGDVVDGPMLAHKAEEDGVFVAELLAGQKPQLHYDKIPSVVYTHPEAASVGLTEEELNKKGIVFKTGFFPFQANGRARAGMETDGFVKLLVAADSGEILGAHMLGGRVSDLISEVVLAMEFQATAEDIALCCHPHPTYSEAIKESALDACGRIIHF